jgi:hypothetical protein
MSFNLYRPPQAGAYTGLRISDVATFHIDRLLDRRRVPCPHDQDRTKVYTWIPDWLQTRIRARAAIHGALIFGTHRATDINVMTDIWQRKLNRLWDLCGPMERKADAARAYDEVKRTHDLNRIGRLVPMKVFGYQIDEQFIILRQVFFGRQLRRQLLSEKPLLWRKLRSRCLREAPATDRG